MKLIKGATFITVIIIWTILGLYLAIPAIMITIVLYVAGVMAAAFVSDNGLLKSAEQLLKSSVSLYPDTFARIKSSIYNVAEHTGEANDAGVAFFKLVVVGVLAIIAATAVWWCLLIILGWSISARHFV